MSIDITDIIVIVNCEVICNIYFVAMYLSISCKLDTSDIL